MSDKSEFLKSVEGPIRELKRLRMQPLVDGFIAHLEEMGEVGARKANADPTSFALGYTMRAALTSEGIEQEAWFEVLRVKFGYTGEDIAVDVIGG